VTVTGPIAATISDLEAAYRLMAIPNPSYQPSTLFAPPRSSTTPPSNAKVIGIYKEWFDRAEPSVLKICNSAISFYQDKLGYTVVDIQIPYVPEGQSAHAFTILCEMAIRARTNPSKPSDWLSGLNPANKLLLCLGDQTPARDYLLAQQMRNMLMQHLAFLYQKYPGLIIVTPTTPMNGWAIAKEVDLKYGVTDGNTSIRNMEYIWLANFTGNPAISCPVGYAEPVKGKGRIPVGLMAMGEWGAEDQLLDWGRECEGYLNEVYPGGRQRPANWEDVVVLAQGKDVDVTTKDATNGV
jgi:Asp-tRNA(Asn)/Glu-tRNA(Gln) amidotransferase A subunit family amidase